MEPGPLSGTIAPFGPVTTVVEANCRFDRVSGDCAIDGQGAVHAFVAFAGGSCDQEPAIHYVTGRVDTWAVRPTPYRGTVLAMAVDGSRPFLLYANSQSVHITKQAADGQFTRGPAGESPIDSELGPEFRSSQASWSTNPGVELSERATT
jgi:hypothetical protein